MAQLGLASEAGPYLLILVGTATVGKMCAPSARENVSRVGDTMVQRFVGMHHNGNNVRHTNWGPSAAHSLCMAINLKFKAILRQNESEGKLASMLTFCLLNVTF